MKGKFKKILCSIITLALSIQIVQASALDAGMDVSDFDGLSKEITSLYEDEKNSNPNERQKLLVTYTDMQYAQTVRQALTDELRNMRLERLEEAEFGGSDFAKGQKAAAIQKLENFSSENLGIKVIQTLPEKNAEIITISDADEADLVQMILNSHNYVQSTEIYTSDDVVDSDPGNSSGNEQIKIGINDLMLPDDISIDINEALTENQSAAAIAELDIMYSGLTEKQKELLLLEMCLREDTMTELEELGYTVKDSVKKALIAQILNIKPEQVLAMIDVYGSEDAAYRETKNFDYLCRNRYYSMFEEECYGDLTSLLVSGFSANSISRAYVASLAMEISVSDLIYVEENLDYNADLTETDLIVLVYHIRRDVIKQYLAEHKMSAAELLAMLQEFEADRFPVKVRALSTDPGEGDAQKAPFQYNERGNEAISVNTGALTYRENLVTIPGINGLDLNITLQYNSDEANDLRKKSFKGTTTNGVTKWENTLDLTYYSDQLSAPFPKGWSLATDKIIIDKYSNKSLSLADGGTYSMHPITGSSPMEYILTDYPLRDVRIYDDNTLTGSGYKAVFKDGTIKYFNIYGALIQVQDRFGNKISYSYIGSELTITHSNNIQVKMSSSTVTLPDGKFINLTSNANGYLETITYQDNTNKTFSYDIGEINFNYFKDKSNDSKNSYGDAKRLNAYNLTTVTYPTGAVTKYIYETDGGRLLGWDNHRGYYTFYRIKQREEQYGGKVYNKETYSYSTPNFNGPYDNSNDLNSNPSHTYTAEVISETTNQSPKYSTKTLYTFNNKHLTTNKSIKRYFVNQWVNAENVVTKYNYEKLPSEITTTVYGSDVNKSYSSTEKFGYDVNGYGNMTSYTDVYGRNTTYSYDNTYNQLTGVEYYQDANTRINEIYTLDSEKKYAAIHKITLNDVITSYTTYSRLLNGNLSSSHEYIDDNNYYQSNYYYNGIYPSSKTRDKITNATKSSDKVNEFWTYDSMGRMTQYQIGTRLTKYNYDSMGKPSKIIYPDNESITYAYSVSVGVNNVTITDEMGRETLYSFDPFGNLSSVSKKDKSTNKYVKLESYTYNDNMEIATSTVNERGTASYTYDALGRIRGQSTNSNQNMIQYSYDDAYNGSMLRKVTTIPANNDVPEQITTEYYDKGGRLVADGFYINTTEYKNNYAYDYVGNLLTKQSVRNAKEGYGDDVTYTYGYGGRVLSTKDAEGNISYNSYDWLGRTTSSKDPMSNTSNYTYNGFNQIIGKTTPLEGNYNSKNTYTYDDYGNIITAATLVNKPNEAERWSTTSYIYDVRNHLMNSYREGVNFDNNTYNAAGDFVWHRNGGNGSCSVIYHGNGNIGGDVPADVNSPYNNRSKVAVLGNTGNLTRTGYTFIGWNTRADGYGTDYKPEETFTISGNTNLYAIWKRNDGSVREDYITNLYTDFFEERFPDFIGIGEGIRYSITGYLEGTNPTVEEGSWTGPAGTFSHRLNSMAGAHLAPSDSKTMRNAIMIDNVQVGDRIEIVYSADTANRSLKQQIRTDVSIPAGETIVMTAGTAHAPHKYILGSAPQKGTYYYYDTGGAYSIYAVKVTGKVRSYTVTYNGNNPTVGSVPTDSKSPYTYDSTITVLGNTGNLVKTGYAFVGWNTKADGSGINYKVGDTFNIRQSVTLYAIWTGTGSGTVKLVDFSNVTTADFASNSDVTVTLAKDIYFITVGTAATKPEIETGGWGCRLNTNGKASDVTNEIRRAILIKNVSAGDKIEITYGAGTTGTSVLTESRPDGGARVGTSTNANTQSIYTITAPASGTYKYYCFDHSIRFYKIKVTEYKRRVSYNLNGGEGPVPLDNYYDKYETAVTPTGENPTKSGYTFTNWSGYKPGMPFTVTQNVTLYANWRSNGIRQTDFGSVSNADLAAASDTTITLGKGIKFVTLGEASGKAYIDNGKYGVRLNTGGGASKKVDGTLRRAIIIEDVKVGDIIEIVYGSSTIGRTLKELTGATSDYKNGIDVLTAEATHTPYMYTVNAVKNGTYYYYDTGGLYHIYSVKVTSGKSLVKYDGNGNNSGAVPSDTKSPYAIGSTVTVLGNTGNLTRTDYTFNGWNTEPDGSGLNYKQGDTLTANSDITLYAKWSWGYTGGTGYIYDELGYVKTIFYADGNKESYENRTDGQPSKKIDRNGNTFTYTYDSVGRLTKISVKNKKGSNLTERKEYTYSNSGKLLTEQSNDIKITYTYDSLGRVINTNEVFSGITIDKAKTYDLAGNVTQLTLIVNGDTKQTMDYTYDKINRLTTVKEDGIVIASYTFNKNSRPVTASFGNGVAGTYQYNKANLPTSVTFKKSTTSLFSEAYTYSLDGNVTTKGDIGYTYDLQNRLKTEDDKNYVFNDAALAKTGYTSNTGIAIQDIGLKGQTTAYTVDDKTLYYSFDNNGNRTDKSGSENDAYTYDAFNRLTNYNLGNAKYSYRTDNLRLKKDAGGVVTFYVWNNGQIIAELDKDGNVIDKYAYGLERIKSQRYGYYIHDSHGDVRVLANASGVVTKTYTYDSYGNITGGTGTSANPFLYAGEYFDAETGLYYLRARYYDSLVGEFLSEDPAKDGVNWYVYAENNPVKFVDPSGLATEKKDPAVNVGKAAKDAGATVTWANKEKTQIKITSSNGGVAYINVKTTKTVAAKINVKQSTFKKALNTATDVGNYKKYLPNKSVTTIKGEKVNISTPTSNFRPGDHGYGCPCGYHGNKGGPHTGTDLMGVKYATSGDPIYAATDGTVNVLSSNEYDSRGIAVEVTYGDITTKYYHLSKYVVEDGATVKAGEKIGVMGDTGLGGAVHLHFEAHIDGILNNPLDYFYKGMKVQVLW